MFANNDSAYSIAGALHQRDVKVTAVVDLRNDVSKECTAIVKEIGCGYFPGFAVRSVAGRHAITSVSVSPLNAPNNITRIDADCLAVAGGWNPVVRLASQMGSPPVFDGAIQSFLPGQPALTAKWTAAGAMRGVFDTAGCLNDGAKLGAEAAKAAGFKCESIANFTVDNVLSGADPVILPEIPGKGKSFVEIQNDVTAKDIHLAHQEGYQSVEHLKRYTTLGRATDQGKTSNVNAISVMAKAQGQAPGDVGTTRFRPPYTPIALGALTDRHTIGHFQPLRRTAMQDWHALNGGLMSDVGLWSRPRAYLHKGETIRDAYIREAANVRAAVGICDVSTLGKIDVQGPNAVEFLNRVYSNPFLKVPVGKARYGLMLREDGMLLDDGTSWRISETQFLMTTTTGGAGTVMLHLERMLSLLWPDLRVCVTSTTSQWAGMSLAGPNARAVLKTTLPRADVSDAALPFMGLLQTEMNGIPVLIARLSFSGELAYEVFTGSDHGMHIWQHLLTSGADFGIMPFGTEALGTLRIEKGHIAGGELDGRISPHNVGLSGMLSGKKDYFGRPLADRDGLHDPDGRKMRG